MNIYEAEGTDGIADLRRAADELRRLGAVTSTEARRAAIAEISTATLLDIALSLRVIAAEARAAMPSPFAELHVGELDETADDAPAPDLLVEGDLVIAEGMTEPGHIASFGHSEGSFFAEVILADGSKTRVWLDDLDRVVDGVRVAAVALEVPVELDEPDDESDFESDFEPPKTKKKAKP